MIQIPVTGVNAILSAMHLGSLQGILFAAQSFIDYQPYVLIYFH